VDPSGVRNAEVEVTQELDAILHTELRPGDMMKLRACAGAGKSMALLQYARRHPDSRMLYVVFNCSVQKDQAKKFTRAHVTNVYVTTLDSLAYHGTKDVHGGIIAEDYNVTADDSDLEEDDQTIIDSVQPTIDAFALSADNEINESHVPRHGAAETRVVAVAQAYGILLRQVAKYK
jgi:predicted ATP-dependent serine protease